MTILLRLGRATFNSSMVKSDVSRQLAGSGSESGQLEGMSIKGQGQSPGPWCERCGTPVHQPGCINKLVNSLRGALTAIRLGRASYVVECWHQGNVVSSRVLPMRCPRGWRILKREPDNVVIEIVKRCTGKLGDSDLMKGIGSMSKLGWCPGRKGFCVTTAKSKMGAGLTSSRWGHHGKARPYPRSTWRIVNHPSQKR